MLVPSKKTLFKSLLCLATLTFISNNAIAHEEHELNKKTTEITIEQVTQGEPLSIELTLEDKNYQVELPAEVITNPEKLKQLLADLPESAQKEITQAIAHIQDETIVKSKDSDIKKVMVIVKDKSEAQQKVIVRSDAGVVEKKLFIEPEEVIKVLF